MKKKSASILSYYYLPISQFEICSLLLLYYQRLWHLHSTLWLQLLSQLFCLTSVFKWILSLVSFLYHSFSILSSLVWFFLSWLEFTRKEFYKKAPYLTSHFLCLACSWVMSTVFILEGQLACVSFVCILSSWRHFSGVEYCCWEIWVSLNSLFSPFTFWILEEIFFFLLYSRVNTFTGISLDFRYSVLIFLGTLYLFLNLRFCTSFQRKITYYIFKYNCIQLGAILFSNVSGILSYIGLFLSYTFTVFYF